MESSARMSEFSSLLASSSNGSSGSSRAGKNSGGAPSSSSRRHGFADSDEETQPSPLEEQQASGDEFDAYDKFGSVTSASGASNSKLATFAIIVGLVLFSTVAVTTYRFSSKNKSGSTTMTQLSTSSISFSLARQNYDLYPYFGEAPNEYAKYAFLEQYVGVIEPNQAMELSVWNYDLSSISSTYKFSVCSTEAGNTDECYLGEHYLVPADADALKRITIDCTPFSTWAVSVEEVSSSGETIAASAGTAVCMYVRREIRSLNADDLSKTMDAMYTLWDVNEEDGQALYGESYHPASYFAAAHDFNAAQQDADHIHEGLGFLPQHIKLTNMFEEAMQSVDSGVALPYWDFTMDVALNQTIFDSVMFTEETFGSITKPVDEYWGFTWANDDLSNTHIQDGRWRKVKAEKNTRYPDLGNGFGYMRGPWNMNPSKYVVRFSAYSPTLPSCSDYYGGLGLPSFMQFLEDAPYGSHASTHGVIGSVFGCDLMDSFRADGLIIDAESQLQICKKWGFYMKELYRANLVSARTDCSVDDVSDMNSINCGFVCNNSTYDSMITGLQDTIGAQYVKGNMDDSDWSVFRDFICEGNASLVFVGDHLESASPSDPSFWPIHPTQERLLQLKYMVGSVSGEAWPTDSTKDYVCDKAECYESDYGAKDYYDACCYGHYENDQLLDFVGGNKDAGYGLTNKQVLANTDPTSDDYAMTYIYDHFEWNHCDEDFDEQIESLYNQHNVEVGTPVPSPTTVFAPPTSVVSGGDDEEEEDDSVPAVEDDEDEDAEEGDESDDDDDGDDGDDGEKVDLEEEDLNDWLSTTDAEWSTEDGSEDSENDESSTKHTDTKGKDKDTLSTADKANKSKGGRR